jgi:hypothetical protein
MVTLRYSSFIDKAGLATLYMGSLFDGAQRPAAYQGKLWMLTPQRELTLVHAVPKPLRDPTVLKYAMRTRVRNETVVEIERLAVDMHAPSTGHLSLEAEWDEYDDRGEDGGSTYPNEALAPETRSGHAVDLPVAYDGQLPPVPLRLEMGDTRRRVLRYRLRGTTRYREYFDRDITTDAQNISRLGPLSGPMDFPATAPPPAPKVAYAVPVFGGDKTASRRVRKGGGLRVYLERPWYASGQGELLAVLVLDLDDASSMISEENRAQVSEWGGDPIAGGAKPGFNMLSSNITSGVSTTVHTLPSNLRVRAVAHQPKYCAERGLWYVDVDLDAGAAYFPFVRLALARYQPHALEGRHLSPTVRLDFVQIAPHRDATLAFPTPARAQITVTGPARVGSEMSLRLEQCPAGSAAGGLAWQPAISASMRSINATTFLGEIDVVKTAGQSYRLVIEEHEVHQGDAHRGMSTARRLVYADAFDL